MQFANKNTNASHIAIMHNIAKLSSNNYNIGLEHFLDFCREPGRPLVQDGYLGSICPGISILKIID